MLELNPKGLEKGRWCIRLTGWRRLRARFLEEITQQRRDLGNLLIHFTRMPSGPVVIDGGTVLSAHPRNVLEKIAAEGRLLGGNGFIKGSYRCVCFTETPISEIPTVLRLAKRVEEAGLPPAMSRMALPFRRTGSLPMAAAL